MSKDFSPDSLKKSVTKRYVIALSIIATLSMLAFYMLFLVLKDSESIAYVVNISGKQRMLSQHIALDVHKIYQVRQERSKEHEEAIQNRLEALCDEMLEANRILSSGELSSTKKIALSDEIRELYFGSKRVAQRVEAYALSAKELGRIKEPKAARELLKTIAHE